MNLSRSRPLVVLCAALNASCIHAQRLTVDPVPLSRLGNASSDTNVLFGAGLVGATRLPDGRVLVAERGDYSLKVFSPDGKLNRRLGRQGSGPGEFRYLAKLWRCGDEILLLDIENGNRITAFSTDLVLQRSFSFRTPPNAGSVPYTSSCDANQRFVHVGWPDYRQMAPGRSRGMVPVWTSGADSTMRPLGEVEGSERWGLVANGRMTGSRPLPLGKEPVVAIGSGRIYVGAATTYELSVFDYGGRRTGTISKPGVRLTTTPADVEHAIEEESIGKSASGRQRVRASYSTMELPNTVPAYKALLVDSEGMLWVQDFPRAQSAAVRWTVFSPDGKLNSQVEMPIEFQIFEIGSDYVLGKYLSADDEIPEIRLYRLRRR